jgi:hypothetical protein
VNPRIEVRGLGTTLSEMGSGSCCEAPSESRAKPWWGTRGQSPFKLLDFGDFISITTCLPRNIHFCHHKWGKIDQMAQKLEIFGQKYKFSLQK